MTPAGFASIDKAKQRNFKSGIVALHHRRFH